MPDPLFPTLLQRHGGLTILRTLLTSGVSCLVIGGTALAFHGARQPLDVGDLDVLISPDPTTIERLRQALSALGLAPDEAAEWERPANRHIPLKCRQYYCDLLTADSTADFDALYLGHTTFQLQDLLIPIAAREALATLLERATADGDRRERRLADLRALAALPNA